MNMTAFFDSVRASLFHGSMTQAQVDGCTTLIRLFEQARWPVEWAAYGLATSKWETDHTLQPIKEYGGAQYFHDRYDPKGKHPAIARALGNTVPGDGAKYFGRGYVQLTGRANYARAGKKLGLDLLKNPDQALSPAVAGQILIAGMTEGWFTGKKLSDYLSPGKTDYVNARRIINGTDKAAGIAIYAQHFEKALRAAGYGQFPVQGPPPPAAVEGFMSGFLAVWKNILNSFKGGS